MSAVSSRAIIAYHIGVTISSVGSLAYTICSMIFMLRSGYSLATVGLLIAACRLLPILSHLTIGDLGDRVSPRKLVIAVEILSALLSLVLMATWSLGRDFFPIFFGVSVFRSCAVALQQNSRGKIAKLLSDGSLQSNSKQAILLNKTTQGATIFAGLIGWAVATYGNFYIAMAIDALSYIIGGLLMLGLPHIKNLVTSAPQRKDSITTKFKVLYSNSRKAVILDVFLAVVSCGATAFSGRLAGDDLSWSALFMAAYGVSVWISASLEGQKWVQERHASIWFALGVCFLGLGIFAGQGPITWLIFMSKDLFKWILFHRYSGQIQHDAPLNQTAAAYAARNIQVSTVMAVGEYAVGSWQNVMPVWLDGTWRAIICILVASVILWQMKQEKKNA